MDLAGLPDDIWLHIFESGNAAILLNLEVVCKTFQRLIALYDTSLAKNMLRKYLWSSDYPLRDGVFRARGPKQLLLWCAQLDVLVDLAEYNQGPLKWPECSRLCSLSAGTELSRSLEHGLAIYQRCALISNHPESQISRQKRRNLRSGFKLPGSTREPEPIYTMYRDFYQKYIQRLSQIDLFDYELLYRISSGYFLRSQGCFGTCRSSGYTSRREILVAVAKLRTASISDPTPTRQQNRNQVIRWTERFSKLWENAFGTRVAERSSLSWEQYRAIPLAIRIAALPITQDNAGTSWNHYELSTVMHRYINVKHPIEARQAYDFHEVSHYLELNPPSTIRPKYHNALVDQPPSILAAF